MPGPSRNSDYMCIIQNFNTDQGVPPISVAAPMPESFIFDSTSNYEAPFAQGLISNEFLKLASAAAGFKTSTQALTVQLWQGSSDTDLGLELEFQTESDPLTDVRDPILNLLRLTTPLADPTTGIMKSPGPHIDTELQALVQNAVGVGNTFGDLANSATTAVGNFFGIDTSKVKVGTLNGAGTSNADGKGAVTPNSSTGVTTSQYWKQRIKNQISIQIGNYMFFDSVVITNVQQTFTSNIDAVTGWPHHAKVAVRFKPLFMITAQDLDTIFISPQSQQAGSGSLAAAGANLLPGLVNKAKGLFT